MTEETGRETMLDVAAKYDKLVDQLVVLRSWGLLRGLAVTDGIVQGAFSLE